MTAFARVEATESWGNAHWELRSVNNRFLDVVPRMPEDFRALEPVVRERIGARIKRGKVDCMLRVQTATEQMRTFTIDVELASRIADASREIDALVHDPARINSLDILRWPGVIVSAPPDLEVVGAAILDLLDRALGELVDTRAREGGKIKDLVATRCEEITVIVATVRERLPDIIRATRERIVARLAEIRDQLDEARVEQEMVLFSQKVDVAEELDRLETHVEEVRRVIDQSKPVGRRLDFLMQELNREANTLGSKSVDTETTRAAVDLKVLIEQMREQVQNVE